MGGAIVQILISICSALFSAALIFLTAFFAHPNPTRGGLAEIGVLIAAPAIVSMVWALLPGNIRPASALLRRAILYYAAFGVGVALFGFLAPAILRASLGGWIGFASLLSPLLIVFALLIGVATPTQAPAGDVHAVIFRIFVAAPFAIGLAFHLGHAFVFQDRMRNVAEGAPFCVGVFAYRDDGEAYYRPARFYDFTYLSLQMDEVSNIGGNGSYRAGAPVVIEIWRDGKREIVIYDDRDQSFYSRGDSPGDGFASPRAEVEGCRPRAS